MRTAIRLRLSFDGGEKHIRPDAGGDRFGSGYLAKEFESSVKTPRFVDRRV